MRGTCTRDRSQARWWAVLIGLMAATCALAAPAAAQEPPVIGAPGPGRVVVTVTALDSTMRIPGTEVELASSDGRVTVAKTTTDNLGQVTFADVPPAFYVLTVARPGFAATMSSRFEVRAGETVTVAIPIHLTFVEPGVEVRAELPATPVMQPVSSSDMLAGSVLQLSPLQGDDFQSLLPLLPGVVRGPDGRLRAKGGQPTQGALQISSASLIDPSTGDFDLQLPGQTLESVQLLANPFAAEYGRFSTSVVQIETRRGTNEWVTDFGNVVPRFRRGFRAIRAFEPRFSVGGPLRRDRVFLAQDFQFRYVSDPVRSMPDEPTIDLTSFDAFARIDSLLSARHALGGIVVLFPREVERLAMDTFRPPETTLRFKQRGGSVGLQDRFAFSPALVLESTLAVRNFEIEVTSASGGPMVFAPDGLAGGHFNDQEREVRSVQWVEALSLSLDRWPGQHLLKFGFDLQHSVYAGRSLSRPVEVRRADGVLAEQTIFGPRSTQDIAAAEVALFAQDQWRIGPRVTLEFGLRMDREDVIDRVNWSPRGGVSVAVLPEGRGILRGGLGRFRQRTPLNIGAFGQFESRAVTRFDAGGQPLVTVDYRNVAAPDLRTPEAIAGNVEWNQRFGRRLFLKANYLRRTGSHEYLLLPEPALGELRLASSGGSKYWEAELTARYLGSARRDLTFSYVRSHGIADLNNYDEYFGNMRQPLVRPNESSLIATDVPHRLLVRGVIGLPGRWDVAPVLELRSGFPWSAVNEYQDFVGPRHRAGRLPAVRTLDVAVSRPWRLWKYRFRAGLRVYNLFGSSAARDVQNNIQSPAFGQFFNPLERSIGIVFGSR